MMFQIAWNCSHQTKDIIQQFSPEAPSQMKKKLIRNVGPILEQIAIQYDHHTWTLLKTHKQLKAFIKKYNEKYKTKLSFGSFLSRGIKEVAQNQLCHNQSLFRQFFEVKDLSINKVKSMTLFKKNGGRHRQKYCCTMNWLFWKQRHFIITIEGIVYYSDNEQQMKQYIPFDIQFQVKKGYDITGIMLDILIITNHRNLIVRAANFYDYIQFLFFVSKAFKEAQMKLKNRYDSFSPQRLLNTVDFKIDGQEYYKSVASSLNKAKDQIFIAGWWVSPEFYLKRPCTPENRLDNILLKAAKRNVKIYILVYYESSFLSNDSLYTKEALESLSQNIKVIRHPLGYFPTLWSHHQKIVIVDQIDAHLGGLDLCYGRYDTTIHQIDNNCLQIFPGIEYNNIRIADFKKIRDVSKDSVPRNLPRLPWHDIGINIRGESVRDVSKHFIQYWNFANFQSYYGERRILTLKTQKKPLQKLEEAMNAKIKRLEEFASNIKQIFKKRPQDDIMVERRVQPSIQNFTQKISERNQSQKFRLERENFKRQITKTDRNILYQINAEEKIQQERQNTKATQKAYYSIPQRNQTEASQSQPFQHKQSQQQKQQHSSISQRANKNIEKMMKRLSKVDEQQQIQKQSQIPIIGPQSLHQFQDLEDSQNIDYLHQKLPPTKKRHSAIISTTDIPFWNQQPQEVQIVRSVSHWSIGCQASQKERSIQNAYLCMISQAKNFIYIENQFFISSVDHQRQVKNQIGEALYQRIKLAIQNKEKFLVYVLMPLIPGMPGQIDHPDNTIVRLIMHWQYKTICRHPNSIYERLKKITPNPAQYIKFLGLRQHGLLDNKPVTQIIYLHSKLMIVDDQKAIIGSANINDRSMQGSRDSQICAIVEKGTTIEKIINGSKVKVSKKIHQLRKKLFSQHFGLKMSQLQDPFNPELQQKINKIIKTNTMIYAELFGCYPDNRILQLSDLHSYKRSPEINQYQEKVKQIKGNVVQFPLDFLKYENLFEGNGKYYPIGITA